MISKTGSEASLKEARQTLAAALAMLEKIERGEAGFPSFGGVTQARGATAAVIEHMDAYIKRRGGKEAGK
jgi:hypothetical protein